MNEHYCCVEWDGRTNRGGYGLRGRQLAHRWVWEQAHGPIPAGMLVLHRCDNPPCVNLEHLFLGTQTDNMADAKAKGRTRGAGLRGERVGTAKLTEAQVREIWALPPQTRLRPVAERLGVSYWTVRRVRAHQSWRHLDGQ